MSNIKRQKIPNCQLCLKPFSFILKQHQCKRCLRAVCAECGKNKAIIPQYDLKTVHRICTICKEEQSLINDLISRDSLIFNKDSATTKKWMRYISPSLMEEQLNQDYFLTLQSSKTQINRETQLVLGQVPQIVQNIRNGLNYSAAEFDYLLTKDLPQQTPVTFIQSVIQCLLFKNPTIKLTEKLISLTLFLLYFNSQPMTYFFINYLREELTMQRFLDQEDTEPSDSEIDFLIEIGKKNFLIESNELIFLRKFLEQHAYSLLSTLLINQVNMPCLYFLFDHLLKFKDLYEYEKAVVLIGKLNMEELKAKGFDKEYLKMHIIRNTHFKQLKEYLCREDRIRLNSKRDVHSKSDDIFFQQFQEKQDNQAELKNLLYMLEECILKQQPLNNYHKQMIGKLHHKQQKIIYELIGMNKGHKLSCVKEEQQYDMDETKGETGSETSCVLKYDLVEQNTQLQEEVKQLKERLSKYQEQRKQEYNDLEQVLVVQENIRNQLENKLHEQELAIQQNDELLLEEFNKKECLSPIRQESLIGIEQLDEVCQTDNTLNNLNNNCTQTQIQQHNEQFTQSEDDQLIKQLENQLIEQKIYYENKLQNTANKQQQLITRLLAEFQQPQQQSYIKQEQLSNNANEKECTIF